MIRAVEIRMGHQEFLLQLTPCPNQIPPCLVLSLIYHCFFMWQSVSVSLRKKKHNRRGETIVSTASLVLKLKFIFSISPALSPILHSLHSQPALSLLWVACPVDKYRT